MLETELTKIFTSKGPDGLSRCDKQKRSAKYNRNDYLFERFLSQRKNDHKLQLNHQHILGTINFIY
jgi:hypothetical protein